MTNIHTFIVNRRGKVDRHQVIYQIQSKDYEALFSSSRSWWSPWGCSYALLHQDVVSTQWSVNAMRFPVMTKMNLHTASRGLSIRGWTDKYIQLQSLLPWFRVSAEYNVMSARWVDALELLGCWGIAQWRTGALHGIVGQQSLHRSNQVA